MTQYANQQDSRKGVCFLFALTAILMPNLAFAATTGAEFQAVYDFVYGAATGYLGRSICIVGGLIGLGFGAASGKALPAILGVVLAIFGALGPTIVNALFDSALI